MPNFLIMKHLKIVFVALFTLGAITFSQAQSKIAHIDSNELIEAMPEFQDARSQMNKLQNNYKSQIEDMHKELQEKSERYESEADSQTDAENERRMVDFQESQQRIMEFQQKAQRQLEEKQEELLRPLLDKAQKAIEKVAKNKGYDYVLDSTEGGNVIVADGHNLLSDVKTEMGIK